ncbi:MAG: glycosylase [Bacteroidetes bacterium]|nr:glycosylase [Bacteroidota bacterium]
MLVSFILGITVLSCSSAKPKADKTLHVATLPDSVSTETMNAMYEEIKTPYKYGMVLIHKDTSNMIDCPTVFRMNDTWYMTYLTFNGRGYETCLAKSADLLHWDTLGRVLPFTEEGRWDWNQAAGYPSLIDHTWGGSYALQPFEKKYWMSYFGSNSGGYEKGLLAIGMANTSTDPTQPHAWNRLESPVMETTDSNAAYWENKKLYKSSIIWDRTMKTGKPFVMYYNAVGDTSSFKSWIERIGLATSDDMIHWERYRGNPILDHGIGLTGDGVIQKIGDVYVMFYYGAFWPEGRKEAFNRFACSYDLIHWTDWTGDDLIKSSEPYDIKYAHKPCVVKWNGTVYHFYCAVNELEQRGLAVATSQDLGKSDLNFPKIHKKLKR